MPLFFYESWKDDLFKYSRHDKYTGCYGSPPNKFNHQ
jgi:hypothetical protein